MADLDNRYTVQTADEFHPGVTITEHGVSLFSSDFRTQELSEGLLIDVSELAREAGYVYPTAVTRSVWEDINAIPAAYSHEDPKGRLWDMLYMGMMAIRKSEGGGMELRYNMLLNVGDTCAYTVKLACEPGDNCEPAITLSNPLKDIDLPLGEIVMTPGALDALVSEHISPTGFLMRHRRGDWGELSEDDIATNNVAVRGGQRVVSAYTLPATQAKVWLITEWDRSVTTILLPSEY